MFWLNLHMNGNSIYTQIKLKLLIKYPRNSAFWHYLHDAKSLLDANRIVSSLNYFELYFSSMSNEVVLFGSKLTNIIVPWYILVKLSTSYI